MRPKGEKKGAKKAAIPTVADREQESSSSEDGPQFFKWPKAALETRRRKKAREPEEGMEAEPSNVVGGGQGDPEAVRSPDFPSFQSRHGRWIQGIRTQFFRKMGPMRGSICRQRRS